MPFILCTHMEMNANRLVVTAKGIPSAAQSFILLLFQASIIACSKT